MKKIILLLLIALTFYFIYNRFGKSDKEEQLKEKEEITNPEKENFTPEKNDISISFEQNGKMIHPENGSITLEKDEFNIVFNTHKSSIFMVTFSNDTKIFDLIKSRTPSHKIYPYNTRGTGMAESAPPEKTITLTNLGLSYWFFKSEDSNRFHSVKKENDNYILKRVVKTYGYTEQEGKSPEKIPFKKVDKPIYMTCLTFDPSDFEYQNELKRNYFKINWK